MFIFVKDAWPFLHCSTKERIDCFISGSSVIRLAKSDLQIFAISSSLLIVDFGEDELEDLVELIHACVSQDQFFKVLDDAFEIERPSEVIESQFGGKNIFGFLIECRDVGQGVLKFPWVGTIEDHVLLPIRPHPHW